MRRCRLLTVAVLLVLPSIFVPGSGYSVSLLPGINTAGSIQQPNCPSGSQFGCFGRGLQQAGGNGAINTGLASTASYPYSPFTPCLQFMQMFLRMGSGAG